MTSSIQQVHTFSWNIIHSFINYNVTTTHVLINIFFIAMHSFVYFCPELVTEEVTRRLLPPLECALTMTVQLV